MARTWKAGSRGNFLARLPIAFAWIDEADYAALIGIMNKVKPLPAAYGDWKEMSERED